MIALRHPVTDQLLGHFDPATSGLPGWALAQIEEENRVAERDEAALAVELCEAVRAKVTDSDVDFHGDGLELWRAFWTMHGFRQQGMAGFQPLSPADCRAWADLTGEAITPAGWRTLFAMDRAFLAAQHDEPDAPALTANLFDAMFPGDAP